MDDRPFAVLSYPYGDRLHYAAAVSLAVSRFDIEMQTREAVRAMIAMVAARPLRGNEPAAFLACECITACVSFIVTFFK